MHKLRVGDGGRILAPILIAVCLMVAPASATSGPAVIDTPAGGSLLAAVRGVTPITIPPTTNQPAEPTALDVLATISVANETPAGYDRDLFPHWASQGNGCDTRDRVLIVESTSPAQVSYPGCAVVAGDWYSTFDGVTTSNPTDLDIDHLVALKEAWDSGASTWSAARRQAFANDLDDPRSLAAVTSWSNGSKGDRDPSNWIPPHSPAVCGYLSDWIAVKARWHLSMDQSEFGRIRNLLTADCPDQPIAAVSDPVVTEPPTDGCDPSYPTVCIPPPPPDLNCGDIPHRAFTVLPPDPHGFDGDGDGVGCG